MWKTPAEDSFWQLKPSLFLISIFENPKLQLQLKISTCTHKIKSCLTLRWDTSKDMETEADTHPHSPSGKGCLSRTVSSSRVGVCRGRAGPQSGFVWAVLHYESVRSDSDGDWELGLGSWAHSWGCMTSTGGLLCRWSGQGCPRGHFSKRASEVDSEPQGREGPPGSLRLPEDGILQGHISLEVPTDPRLNHHTNPGIPLLGMSPKELKAGTQGKTCTWMFAAALFTIVRRQKQPKCPLVDKWINKM